MDSQPWTLVFFLCLKQVKSEVEKLNKSKYKYPHRLYREGYKILEKIIITGENNN